MATPYQERKLADPLINVGDEPYFEATAQGKLLYKQCEDCGKPHHYPRGFCPFCFSDKVSWREAKGTGKIHTYSVTRRAGPHSTGGDSRQREPRQRQEQRPADASAPAARLPVIVHDHHEPQASRSAQSRRFFGHASDAMLMSMADRQQGPGDDGGVVTDVRPRTERKLKKPKLYKVLLRTYAVWAGDEDRILFYNAAGARFAEVHLSEAPDPRTLTA